MLSLQQAGGLRSVGLLLTATTRTTIYTADTQSRPYMVALNVANRGGASVNITVEWFSAKDNRYTAIEFARPVATGGPPLRISDFPVALFGGDQICVTSSVTNVADVCLLVMERNARNQ